MSQYKEANTPLTADHAVVIEAEGVEVEGMDSAVAIEILVGNRLKELAKKRATVKTIRTDQKQTKNQEDQGIVEEEGVDIVAAVVIEGVVDTIVAEIAAKPLKATKGIHHKTKVAKENGEIQREEKMDVVDVQDPDDSGEDQGGHHKARATKVNGNNVRVARGTMTEKEATVVDEAVDVDRTTDLVTDKRKMANSRSNETPLQTKNEPKLREGDVLCSVYYFQGISVCLFALSYSKIIFSVCSLDISKQVLIYHRFV